MQRILDYLKNHGERLDSEIAAATGMSVENVRVAVSDLSAKGDGQLLGPKANSEYSDSPRDRICQKGLFSSNGLSDVVPIGAPI
jgi:hypothetical protein